MFSKPQFFSYLSVILLCPFVLQPYVFRRISTLCIPSYFNLMYSVVFQPYVFRRITTLCIPSYYNLMYSIVLQPHVFNRITTLCIHSYYNFMYSVVIQHYVFRRTFLFYNVLWTCLDLYKQWYVQTPCPIANYIRFYNSLLK